MLSSLVYITGTGAAAPSQQKVSGNQKHVVAKDLLKHVYATQNPVAPLQRSHIRMDDFSQKCIKLITFNTLTSTIYSQKQAMVH